MHLNVKLHVSLLGLLCRFVHTGLLTQVKMDPVIALAVAGKAFQFAELAINVFKVLCCHINNVRNALKEATELYSEIRAMI